MKRSWPQDALRALGRRCANVCYWHFSDIPPRESGHGVDVMRCLLLTLGDILGQRAERRQQRRHQHKSHLVVMCISLRGR